MWRADTMRQSHLKCQEVLANSISVSEKSGFASKNISSSKFLMCCGFQHAANVRFPRIEMTPAAHS